jgi:hypothetical protein
MYSTRNMETFSICYIAIIVLEEHLIYSLHIYARDKMIHVFLYIRPYVTQMYSHMRCKLNIYYISRSKITIEFIRKVC